MHVGSSSSADVQSDEILRRRRRVGSLAAIATLVSVSCTGALVAASAEPAVADWSDDNCSWSGAPPTGPYSRAVARYYSSYYWYEGYHWGGGCYLLDDIDNSPGESLMTLVPRGEGNDCSGFVDRIWGLNDADAGFLASANNPGIWHKYHGTGHFISSSGTAWGATTDKQYKNTDIMDAFVYDNSGSGHIGLIYDEGSGGFDWIVEAAGEAGGTNLNYRNYRSDSSYQARYRYKWA